MSVVGESRGLQNRSESTETNRASESVGIYVSPYHSSCSCVSSDSNLIAQYSSLGDTRGRFVFTRLWPRPTGLGSGACSRILIDSKEPLGLVTSDSWRRDISFVLVITSGRAGGNEGIFGAPSHLSDAYVSITFGELSRSPAGDRT
jgi:hypothetical protein